METKKLYYGDCHLTRFSSIVTGCRETGGGYLVSLESTAFYPGGGGQDCDTGTLGSANVLSVREEAGEILHLCDRPLAAGRTVTGQIDWERRFDQMQQHSGEHIVSGIINRRFGYHNVGFHMGSDVVTIDFDGELRYDMLAQIEAEANEAIWRNLPVRCWYPSQKLLPTLNYRSKRELPWPVRIVEIHSVDKCACCGVHVSFTGEIGMIKLLSCVKFHQGCRIEMVCGRRCLHLLAQVYEQARHVGAAFSAKLLETGAAADRMNEALAQEKLRRADTQRQLFALTARQYAGQSCGVHFAQDLSSAEVRLLCGQISGQAALAAVFSGTDGDYTLCLSGTGAETAFQALVQRLGAKGGGRDGFYQGRVRASRNQIETLLSESGCPALE